ncbi:MAG TPA: murein biosynthesis integral membrane protein MurJ [Polyangiaceae bacterium]|nr:murein biosynthesis integral membrane protein MurJ [Polyangiaceae bacterium]
MNETAPAPAPPAGEHRSPPRGASEPGAEARAASARERSRIAGRAGIVAAGTLLSRLLGLGRDLVMAAVFTRAVTDAFFVAFTLPNVLRQLLAEGAVQSAVLPVLAATRERDGDDAARRFFANVRGLSLSLLTVVTALGVAFAPALVDLFAAGYREHPEQFERTVELTRWVFPYIFLMGTAALGVAALNAYQRFAVTAFAPALLNVAFVTFSLLLPDFLGARGYDPGLALAVAVIVGGVLQVVAQWPSLAKIGFLGRPRFDFGHPGVRAVLTRMVPVLFGMGVYYVDVLLARRFLSELGVGAQSYFTWAMRLCDFPQGIFVMAIQTAALPSLARLASRGDRVELAGTFAFGMRLALFVAVPATLFAVVLAEPLVVLLFQRGEFDAIAAHETARALMAQGAGIWLVAVARQLVGLYYAIGDTRTPVIVSAIDLFVFIALALFLKGPLGHVGVSLAVTGATAVQMLLLWVLAHRRLPELRSGEILTSFLRTSAAAAAAVGLALFSTKLLAREGISLGVQAIVGAAAGLSAFFGLAGLLKSPELGIVAAPIARRFRTRRH